MGSAARTREANCGGAPLHQLLISLLALDEMLEPMNLTARRRLSHTAKTFPVCLVVVEMLCLSAVPPPLYASGSCCGATIFDSLAHHVVVFFMFWWLLAVPLSCTVVFAAMARPRGNPSLALLLSGCTCSA